MECILIGIFAIVLVVFTLLYYRFTFNFWKNLGVRGPRPNIIFGNCKDLTWPFEKVNLGSFTKKLYEQYSEEPVIGIFDSSQPILLIKDITLIKEILVKEFNKFSDRGIPFIEKVEPLSAHLINLEKSRWTGLRKHFSPMFSGAKLKRMFNLINECSEHFLNYMDLLYTGDETIECREMAAQYTTEVIGSCAFGLEINPLRGEESEFRKFGRSAFTPVLKRRIKRVLRKLFPKLLEIWPFSSIFYDRQMHEFFVNVMRNAMKARRESGIDRGDCIDMLRMLKDNPDKLGG